MALDPPPPQSILYTPPLAPTPGFPSSVMRATPASQGVREGEAMKCLVTGAAGFIGSHLCERLLADGHEVVGLDAFIPFYPRILKELNLSSCRQHRRFAFHALDLRTDDLRPALDGVDVVYHLAAMA